MTDDFGHFISHPETSKNFAFELYEADGLFEDFAISSFPKRGFYNKTLESGETLVARQFELNSERKLIVAIKDSGRDHLVSAEAASRYMLVFTLIALIMMIFLIYYIFSSLSMPINALNSVVQRYRSEGELSSLPSSITDGELGLVAETFQGFVEDAENKTLLLEEASEKQSQAESANLSKSKFLANMSHEIRTPLNAVIGYAELFMYEDLNSEQKMMMESIQQSSQTLMSLINDILDLSKIEAGEIELEEVPFSLEEVLFIANEQLLPHIQGKNLELLVDAGGLSNRAFIGDPTRLKQILVNFIGNAVKFTNKGEILTSARVLSETDKFIEFEVSVKDSGIGIPDDKKRTVFEAFKQAESSTTREYGGTGLGLSITKKLIDMMDSEVKIESEVGEGSRFSFILSLEKAEDLSEDYDISRLSKKKIIYLDSNKSAIAIIKSISSELGLSIDCYESIEDAAAIKNICGIDIFINALPLKQTANIRTELFAECHSRPKSLAVVKDMSSDSLMEVKIQKYDSFMIKPLRLNTFYQMLKECLEVDDGFVELSLEQQEQNKIFMMKTAEIDKAMMETDVLLVDDNEINQKVALNLMGVLGCNATLATNGQEAVDAVEGHDFDIIFMDLKMPVMDGFNATKIIRERGVKTPIVALTANVFDSDRQACAEAGMDDFLPKPVKNDSLREVISKYSSKFQV